MLVLARSMYISSTKQSQSGLADVRDPNVSRVSHESRLQGNKFNFNEMPDLILEAVLQHLDVDDRLNASVMSKKFRDVFLRRKSIRDMQVSISSYKHGTRLRGLMSHTRNLKLCVGLVKPSFMVSRLHEALTYCTALECLDISKSDADGEVDIELEDYELANANNIKEFQASWYFSRTACFKELLRACQNLDTLTLTEPLCRFRLDSAARSCLVDLPFNNELSDGADILYANFFDFLARVANFGIKMDRFFAEDRVLRRSDQRESYAVVLDGVERALKQHTLCALALPRLALRWNHDTSYRILERQAATLTHLVIEFTDHRQVERVAQCVNLARLRCIEFMLREPHLTPAVGRHFFLDSRAQRSLNLVRLSLTGVRLSQLTTVVSRWSTVRSLSLAHVGLSNNDFRLIARECRCLQRFRLNGCRSITAFDLRFIATSPHQPYEATFEKLVAFEASNCANVNEESFEFFIVPSLRQFSLHSCARPQVRPRIWRFLADNCPLLVTLSLKHRDDCPVGGRHLETVFESIARLKCLRVLRSFRYVPTKRKRTQLCSFARCCFISREEAYNMGSDQTAGSTFLEQLAIRFPLLSAEICDI